MPFVLLFIGVGFFVIAVRGTEKQAVALLKSEFIGANSFFPWISSIIILCALGSIKTIRPITDSFVGLVILVMLLKADNGFFAAFNQQIRNPVAPPSPVKGN